jgi:N-acetylglutamate synthase-like GNAT family acetyltransferase
VCGAGRPEDPDVLPQLPAGPVALPGRPEERLLEADYIVVEMARQILGEDWLQAYVARANQGGIERVLV